MIQELQEATAATLRVGLEAIQAAIQDAYNDTRTQMVEGQFSSHVVHTAFGQFLVHNVRNRIIRIESPGLVCHPAPNQRGTAYHETVFIEKRLFLTISAVSGPQSPPRHAWFRTSYANGPQSWFRITEQDEFEPMVPVESTTEYVQILHGSRGLSGPERQELGFIQVAFPNSAGGYRRAAISLDAYIAELSQWRPAEPEVVREEGNLGVKIRERHFAGE